MKPYYEHAGITLYHGDCREILPSIEADRVDLVLTDPPYGIALDTAYGARRPGAVGGRVARGSRDHPRVYGDDVPFDPAPLLRFPRLILFGANHYADRLPPSGGWIVWDKLDGLTTDKRPQGFNDGADAELAWTNLGGTVRMYRHMWNGVLRKSEIGEHLHPTQKPVALMHWLIQRATGPRDLILDPYMGSGPVVAAARNLGRRAIGIEIDERYCEIAAKRCAQGALDFAA